jgi:transcription elongation GreA/GreB family factor
MEEVKQRLFDYCVSYVNLRINNANEAIRAAQESANEESKNSSGDKYETSRAMMQIDVEQNLTQLGEAKRLKSILEKISKNSRSETIQNGSLVVTDQGKYFIAISIGQVKIDGASYFVISAESPVGAKMMGLRAGQSFSFADRIQRIDAVH